MSNIEIESLRSALHDGEVKFSYKKVDGNVRTAKGTLRKDLLPDVQPERIKFPVTVINALMEAKQIKSLDEYAEPNGLRYIGRIDIEGCEPEYIFEFVKKSKNKEGYFTYFDLDKNEFRSFVEENYIGIVEE